MKLFDIILKTRKGLYVPPFKVSINGEWKMMIVIDGVILNYEDKKPLKATCDNYMSLIEAECEYIDWESILDCGVDMHGWIRLFDGRVAYIDDLGLGSEPNTILINNHIVKRDNIKCVCHNVNDIVEDGDIIEWHDEGASFKDVSRVNGGQVLDCDGFGMDVKNIVIDRLITKNGLMIMQQIATN